MKKRVRQTDVVRFGRRVAGNRVIGDQQADRRQRAYQRGDSPRVVTAVDELGYVADAAARSLAGGQNYLLGVFTFESIFPLQHRDFYYPFLVGIEEEAEQLGYDLLLFTSGGSVDGVRQICTVRVSIDCAWPTAPFCWVWPTARKRYADSSTRVSVCLHRPARGRRYTDFLRRR